MNTSPDAALAFDPLSVGAEMLAERYPTIGLFVAEDIVGWRDAHGMFPPDDVLVTLGVDADLAATMTAAASGSGGAGPTPVSASRAPPKAASAPPPDDRVANVDDVEDVRESSAETDDAGIFFASTVSAGASTPYPPLPTSDIEPAHVAPEATPGGEPSPALLESASVEPEPAPAVVPVPAPPAHPAPKGAKTPSVKAPKSVAAAAPTKASRIKRIALSAGISIVAAGVTAFVSHRIEQKRARAPIAAVATEVAHLQTDHASTRSDLDETKAKLEDTSRRVEDQAKLLAQTRETVAANAKKQSESEHTAREREGKDDRERALLAARMARVEQKTYRLDEAMKLVDLVQGRASSGAHPERAPAAPSSPTGHATEHGAPAPPAPAHH